ncbi:hypothetical protein OAG53_00220 [Akkermansiaceae bacterium]|nr:hypothetical protein [Akkermansiaceae bacterium]
METKIFTRFLTRERQAIAYQMRLDAPEEVAMILPLPVVQPAGEKAVEFINLEKYEDFFADLKKGFPSPVPRSKSWGKSAPVEAAQLLEVVHVGAFVASFVSSAEDFTRLDPQFRLPEGTWDKLPQYADYGFAVFQLKKGEQKVHPMAFTFPSRLAEKAQLYFPTVHIHDGKVHEKESFDHVLYGQTWPKAGLSSRKGWEESASLAGTFTKVEKSKGLIWKDGHVYRKKMKGEFKNEDVIAQAILVG